MLIQSPTAKDAHINTIDDYELQVDLHWATYVQRLRDGAWGDHVAIQGICDMFNTTVHVLSSQNPNMIHILPRSYISCDLTTQAWMLIVILWLAW